MLIFTHRSNVIVTIICEALSQRDSQCSLFSVQHYSIVMEAKLKEVLGTSILKRTGSSGGGCINEGEAYHTDTGTVFVKRNSKPQSRVMFEGEYESLKAIADTATVSVPKPILVVDNPKGGAALVMEYVEMKGCKKYHKLLGEKLAAMHLHNIELLKHGNPAYVGKEEGHLPIDKFGFHTTTCCGYLPMENEWCDDWPTFFARQRLEPQLRLIEKDYRDKDARDMWSRLQLKIPSFFEGLEIQPSLLHGDLWSGNAAETPNGPIVFDPASFYGHHEYELSITTMFGGFSPSMFQAYHKVIPKAVGFDNRQKLYQLFHYLNHWNHFGSGYRSQSLSIMRQLVK